MSGGRSAGGLFEAGPPRLAAEGQPQPLAPAAGPGERWEPHRALGMPAGLCIPQQHMGPGREERRWCGAGTGLSSEPGGWPVPEVGSGPKWAAAPALVPYRSPPACGGTPQPPRTLLPSPSPSPAQRQRLLHILCERGRRQTLGEQLRRGLLGTDLGSRGHVHGRN